jgi:DNA-binding transcriptional regulator LsrR (DeoR family)
MARLLGNRTVVRPPSERLHAFLAELARAYYELDLTQEEIAAQFGVSRSQVSRYLRMARELEIVQIRVVAPEARDTDLESQLRQRFEHLVEAVVPVVFSDGTDTARRAVARFTARVIERLAPRSGTIAFGAGRTLAAAVELLAEQPRREVAVVQAMGNAGHEALDIDYNVIAQRAAAACGGRVYQINAPAILGPGQRVSDLEAANPSIAEGLRRARAADLVVTGIGSMSGDEIYVKTGLVSLDELTALAAEGAVGDVCGNFFDISGRPVPGPYADRVVGIRFEDVRRARTVVACAAGREKVPAILGALRARLVTSLVTDEHAARGVLELADARGRRRPVAVRQGALEAAGGVT